MRILSVFFVATLAIGLGTGCSSTLSSNDGSGSGGSGSGGSGSGGSGSGTGGSGQGGSGAMTCTPACGSGSVCVGSGTVGGALIRPDDAGVCPTGRHASGDICVTELAYACMIIPAGCGGTVTCECASTLCPASHACQPSGPVLTCIEAVP